MFNYILLIFLLLLSINCFSFYLPGVAPRDYEEGEPIARLIN